jgi:predicted outer membrane protein
MASGTSASFRGQEAESAEHESSRNRQRWDEVSLGGAAFNRAYTRNMISGHEKAIEKFETGATSGQDPEVKAVATPKVHLALARKTVRQVD